MLLLRQVRRLLTALGVILIILFALLLSAGRWLVSELPRYHDRVEQALGDTLGRPVEIASIEGHWPLLVPIVEARGLRIPGAEGPALLRVARVRLEFDLLRSLLNWAPVFQRLELDRPELELHQRASGAWGVAAGWGLVPLKEGDNSAAGTLNTLWLQREIILKNALVTPVLMDGRALPTRVVTLGLQNRGKSHDLVARVELSPERAVELKAHSRGVPGEPRFSADFYLNVPPVDLQLVRPFMPAAPALPAELVAGAELWGRWRNGQLRRLDGALAVERLAWPQYLGEQALEAFGTRLQLRLEDADGGQLQLNDIAGRLGGQPLPLSALRLAVADQQLSLSADRLELEETAAVVRELPALPAAAGEVLAELAPRGRLEHPHLTLPLGDEWQLEAIRLRADLHRVGVAAWKGAPALQGVDGLLQVEGREGRVDLQSEALTLNFPRLFDRGWQLDRALGRVHWRLEDKAVQVYSELLEVVGEGVRAKGRFSLESPQGPEAPGALTLLIGLEDGDAAQAPHFVPRLLPEGLYSWLQNAIGGGRVEQGGFVYRGPLIPSRGESPSVQMFFDVAGATLDYQPGWPALEQASGRVLVKDGALAVAVDEARIYEQTRVTGARVTLAPETSLLEVKARLTGPAADGRRVLLEAPTGEHLGEAFAQWQLEGEAVTQLDLGIDLKAPGASQIRVATTLEDARYHAPELKLAFEQVNGTLRYDHSQGLSVRELSGRFFGQPVTVAVQSEEQPDGRHTQVHVQGAVAMAALNDWLQLPLLSHLEGVADYRASLDICPGEPGCTLLSVRSELEGVRVALPPPYGKGAEQGRPLHLRLSLGGEPQWLRIRYGEALHTLLALGPGGLAGGELVLGADQPEPAARPQGLWIRGTLPAVEVQPWQAFIKELVTLARGEQRPAAQEASSSSPLLREVAVSADRLLLDEHSLESVQARLTPAEQAWTLNVESPAVKGVVTLPLDEAPYRAVFERLYLPQKDAAEESGLEPADPLADFDPGQLPALRLQVEDLRYGDAPYGRWALNMDPATDGVRIRGIEGRLRGVNILADLWWSRGEAGHHTRTNLVVTARDLADVMRAWDRPPVMESESARVSGELVWQGSPIHFDLATLSGELKLSARDGRFLDAGDAGSLKPFGLLNLGTLRRRLRLDFSDLYQKGLAFDRIEGQYLLNLGVAVSQAPLKISGPSADIVLEGSANLVEKTLNQRMRVTLPVSESLPLTAALLGGPQVAGAVFLIEKVIGKQLRKFTSIRYLVYGPWEDPVVEPIRQNDPLPQAPVPPGQ